MLFETTKKTETAVLVGLISQKQPTEKANEYLDELAFLAETGGVRTVHRFLQRLDKPDTRTFVGKGKLAEIASYVLEHDVDNVIFDDDLAPSQVRNLETELKVKILDRSLLILNIFSQRAQSAQSRTQVELAQYQYLLPRLTRMWTHLTKQKGGVGMRGPGEKELETDKRIVQDRISFLRDKLDKIDKQSVTRRKERARLVRVALVGYTNVGKSTLMRELAKTDVFAENKLFATVDSTVRKVVLDNIPFLLTDTVGFIRKLPTKLIESFKSTLDEIREADILLHVVDVSHPAHEEQIAVVNQTLADIGAADKPVILVFNKVDLYKAPVKLLDPIGEEEDEVLDESVEIEEAEEDSEVDVIPLKRVAVASPVAQQTLFVSAEKRENLAALRQALAEAVAEKHFMIYPNWVPGQPEQEQEMG